MVVFNNVNVGQIVEVLMPYNVVELAKVRYKGSINLMRGDWIGLEMARKVGNNDGMIEGRRYFIVREGYGYFTTADKIRFRSTKRRTQDRYKKVDNEDIDYEELFGTSKDKDAQNNKVQNVNNQKISKNNEGNRDETIILAKESLQKYKGLDLDEMIADTEIELPKRNHHLNHYMGQFYKDRQKQHRIEQGTYDSDEDQNLNDKDIWKSPEEIKESNPKFQQNQIRQYSTKKYKFRNETNDEWWNERKDYFLHPDEFLSPPTIPDYYVPRQKIHGMLERKNLEKIHLPKTYMDYTMRDMLHQNNRRSGKWWNDVSY